MRADHNDLTPPPPGPRPAADAKFRVGRMKWPVNLVGPNSRAGELFR